MAVCGWHRNLSRFHAFITSTFSYSRSLGLQWVHRTFAAGSSIVYQTDQCVKMPTPAGCFQQRVSSQFQTRCVGQQTQKPLIKLTFRYFSAGFSVNRGHGGHAVYFTRKLSSQTVETPKDTHTLLIIQPDHKSGVIEKPYVPAESKLEEAVSLAEAITGWKVQGTRIDILRKPHSKFVFGKGKIAELQTAVKESPVSGVFINIPKLSPLQHRSLETLFEKEVFDRFSIVLRIFKERAKTREAKVQVELAEIPYLRSRLVKEEGEFDQQRGGTGKTGGAGETSLEISRRTLISREKILKDELSLIRNKRSTSRSQRAKHSLPIVAVVGYTNAGKTTLIKALSKDDRLHPEDMLFATLDTTMHAGKLPCGLRVIYVDTIGFISDLPHELVESFASTLEDVTSADVIVHVCDVSHPKSYAQRANVLKVLHQLNLQPQLLEDMIEVLNKADQVERKLLADDLGSGLLVSATEGVGLKDLLLLIEDAVLKATNQKRWKVVVPADRPHLSWLHHEATVCSVRPSERGEEQLEVEAILSDATVGKFKAKFGNSVMLTSVTRT